MTDADFITLIVDRLNEVRLANGFQAIGIDRIAKCLAGRTDIKELYETCAKAENFSVAFWSLLIPRTKRYGPHRRPAPPKPVSVPKTRRRPGLSEAELRRRSEVAQNNWRNPETRARMVAAQKRLGYRTYPH